MVRAPRLDSNGVKKGAWSIEEDNLLRSHVNRFGHPNWRMLPLLAGLARLGKSCRLRWMNYLKPGLKRGNFTKQEQEIIIKLHNQVGNRWSTIAAKLPGRTDNEVKNHWHAHINRHNKQRVNIKAIKPHQEQTLSLINYCTINQNPKCDNIDLGDPYYVTHEPYDQICMSHLKTDLSSFLEEEFFDFEEMITWNSNNAEIRGKSWCDQPFEEDTFDVVLW